MRFPANLESLHHENLYSSSSSLLPNHHSLVSDGWSGVESGVHKEESCYPPKTERRIDSGFFPNLHSYSSLEREDAEEE